MLISSYRVSNKPVIHPEFKKALSKLPKQYQSQFKSRFYKLIDNFGTHFITKVTHLHSELCRIQFHHVLHIKYQKDKEFNLNFLFLFYYLFPVIYRL